MKWLARLLERAQAPEAPEVQTHVAADGSHANVEELSMLLRKARVKARAENALMQMPFKATYMFRPGFIQPMHGIKSRTRSYRIFYMLFGWMMPILRRLFPAYVTSTEQIGRAMLEVAKRGYPQKILESGDINIAAVI